MLKRALIITEILFSFVTRINAITIPTVPVSRAGNPNDLATGSLYGGVAYKYNIGKHEVTVGQYTAFLNAVAAADTYALYNTSMATDLMIAGIARSGASPSYTYSVIGSANHPVTFVSWGDAARFANWTHNGQPTGAQGPGTTETGAYALNGATSNAALIAVVRNPGATWFIPTENEWYKAAYHQPAIQGGDPDNYWAYPMRTNSVPYSDQPPGATPNNTRVGNFNANDGLANGYDDGLAVTGSGDFISTQNYLTDVGAYSSSPSFWGTFDQGGNVWEWNEALISGSFRGYRGGAWNNISTLLLASNRGAGFDAQPTNEYDFIGFRVATIPEPSTLILAALAISALITLRLRRRDVRTVVLSWTMLLFAADVGAVTIPTVLVGDAGNAGELSGEGAGGHGTSAIVGGVPYNYRIATTEVTNAQYAEFLNAKAKTTALSLYSTSMGSDPRGGITRSGASGSFTYSVKSNMGDKPVNFVTWYDAIRFTNWLHNGQGTGSTEGGAYTMLGGTTTPSNGLSIQRNNGARWFLPSEDEWYKAAYHQPAAQGGSFDDYWFYPTASNIAPIVAAANVAGDISNPGINVANYAFGADWNALDGSLTTVGTAGPMSRSYYGTSDQGGNIWEWTEALIDSSSRNIRGGSYGDVFPTNLQASFRERTDPRTEFVAFGFRVATVPEPSTFALAALGIVGLVLSRKRRRAACAGIVFCGTAILTAGSQAIAIPTVPVGNAGNAADVNGCYFCLPRNSSQKTTDS